ncbi:acetaldehyde dehydrogenase (acetylating) [Facilibium subflavum]|uniref:acetaldehyde dehydrogenase (acetylating) n=1 Tax=Facilibium subflavum TaxID=2219058 RepID=UPI000E65C5D6|nr:acetaldehyde dehydrogenase (acetylating) [Facilibium subflavum]
MQHQKIKAVIIGSGNIGIDILLKLQRSPWIRCNLFIGRRLDSKGIAIAKSLDIRTDISGIDALLKYKQDYDLVFDATSAQAHLEHASVLKGLGKQVVDLTPAKLGKSCIPVLNIQDCVDEDNINMVTCGGQASTPIAYALLQAHKNIEYIEVVSSIAAKSAGSATRINIDEYINTTEAAIKEFSGCLRAKSILNINPAEPCVEMKTTIFAKIYQADLKKITDEVNKVVEQVKKYVPGYSLVLAPQYQEDKIMVMVKVLGQGDYLPSYAGNLDIITAAAVQAAEEIAKNKINNFKQLKSA